VDNDYSIDLDDIVSTLSGSDVVVMRFVALGQRLLLDFRATELEGPMVRVVAPVKSVQDRYKELKVIRPRFPTPERITAVLWPRFARSLRDSPAWTEVLARISDTGHADSVRAAKDALEQIIALEHRTECEAVRGEGFRTLWSASARRR
jgi:hypothetical protein